MFQGWWRREGGWVVTLAADPAPEEPQGLLLDPADQAMS
jgi:hypothetical protein